MGKFYGPIGYAEMVETKPGVYKPQITVHYYSGDVIKNASRQTQSSDSTNDDITIDNQFSIIADPFAYQNFLKMKYIGYMGVNWKITNVKVERPRLIVNVGGVYNGEQA